MDGLNEKKENSARIQSLMEFIDEDANPPVQQKPYWLCMQCMNSYSSRHYLFLRSIDVRSQLMVVDDDERRVHHSNHMHGKVDVIRIERKLNAVK